MRGFLEVSVELLIQLCDGGGGAQLLLFEFLSNPPPNTLRVLKNGLKRDSEQAIPTTKTALFQANLQLSYDSMENSHYRLNFDQSKNNKIYQDS